MFVRAEDCGGLDIGVCGVLLVGLVEEGIARRLEEFVAEDGEVGFALVAAVGRTRNFPTHLRC